MAMRHFLAVLFLAFSAQAFGASLVVGERAPELDAKLLDGSTQLRVAANSGKVTIINFWATWCEPCREEMPAIDAYYKKHKAEGLEVLAISMDMARDADQVRKLAQQFSFPIALKSDANFQGFGRISRLPVTFVIDKQGVLRMNGYVGDPKVDLPLLESLVTPLLQAH
jgi:thiol-disulfide isomerase/thioredoxin